jgi:hypothetical protein
MLLPLALVIVSNHVHAQCVPVPVLCDANDDRLVDQSDIDALILAKGTAVGPGDTSDPDMDGVITTLDARECVNNCEEGACEVPRLLGPLLPANQVNMAPGYLAQHGYQAQDFILADIARSYTATLPLPTDGKLVVTEDPEIVAGDFNTRVVVYRPIDPADFNGTVVVEWLNVSAGGDTNPNWIMAHNDLLRRGTAWVGVSAQATGVNNLVNNSNPDVAARFASLVHPSDSYSYDIFSKAGQFAGEPVSTLLDGLTADVLIATGESQSAMRMVTYIDAVHPLKNIFDGYFVHSRFGPGMPISQSPLPSVPFPAPAPIRDDLGVPVIVVQAEGDVLNSNLASRQPATTALVSEWEMAGTSHADSYTLLGLSDPGDGSATETMFNFMRAPQNPFNCMNGFNAGSHWLIVQAAHRALDDWIRYSVAPPVAPLLSVDSVSPLLLTRDQDGNVLGGVRSPHVDVPVATLDSENAVPPGGFAFCGLFGRTIPFTSQRIVELYPTKADFLQLWSGSIDDAVASGFMIFEDGEDLKAAANAWNYPN